MGDPSDQGKNGGGATQREGKKGGGGVRPDLNLQAHPLSLLLSASLKDTIIMTVLKQCLLMCAE